MPGESLDIPIQATGGDAAAAEIGKATRAVDAFSQHSKNAAASSATLAANTQKLSAGLGAFGGALGSIDPVLGQFGASIGRAGGAIGAMTSLIGGGPGVLFGGAVAAIGLLANAWRDSQAAAEAARKATEDKTKALEAEARAADKARVSLEGLIAIENQRSARSALETRLRLGAGTVEEQRGNLADIERRLAASARRDSAGNIIGSDPALRAELENARRALATSETFSRIEGDEAFLNQFGGASSARSGGSANDNARMDARLAQALGEGTGGRASDDDVFGLMTGGGLGRSPGSDQTGFDDFISSAASRGIGEAERFGDVRTGGGGATKAEQAREQADAVKAAWQDAGATAASSIAGILAAQLTGSEMSTEAMLAALGDQAVASGTNAMFTGAVQLATGNPLGTTTIGIGAAWAAFGLTLGATMSPSQPGSTAARPTPGMNGGNGGQRDQGPTVINVYALNPNAEAGKAMAKADRMRNQRRLAS